MNEIRFILIDEVYETYRYITGEFGGDVGIRDEGQLMSALEQPKAGAEGEYFHKDLYEMAAAYLYHIVQNHPFIDGNKRMGAMLALQFLALNSIEVVAANQEFQRMVERVATGEIGKSEIARFFTVNSRKAGE